MLSIMAQFLIITENSMSLQRSPIMHVNCRRLSKRDYIILLRTLSKYLFYRRLHFHKDEITFDFLSAHRLESRIESFLTCSTYLRLSDLSFLVYVGVASTMCDYSPSDKCPILFNLDSYELSFFDAHYYDNRIYDGLDLPYTSL